MSTTLRHFLLGYSSPTETFPINYSRGMSSAGTGAPTILGTNFARFSKRKLGFQEELASRVRTAEDVPKSWKIVHAELETLSLVRKE